VSVPVIGVMGAGRAGEAARADAAFVGRLIAEQGWITLSGGRDAGVMAAVSEAARAAGGLTVGILPGKDRAEVSPHVLVPICTGLGDARNAVNVASADVVVAVLRDAGAGTVSEIALACKAGKPVLLLGATATDAAFWQAHGMGVEAVTRDALGPRLQALIAARPEGAGTRLPPLPPPKGDGATC